ncbi:substrate-binding and VWA domain-containing protein [Actinophytocola glycyrrhizae]|uniref:Substrate-binding and VWA domain-containing protein n=1 Tax=Actinophytocola glycyrrhizae TaxID=2044873 RepID=A0ABV9RSP5_9PSEU
MLRRPPVVLGTLLVLTVALWIGYPHVDFSSADCTRTLRVTASPEIAPVVEAAADRMGDACARVLVTPQESSATADALAEPRARQPDVWIPESTVWLQRTQARRAWELPVGGTSVASSPVVLGVTKPVADRLGAPLTWARVLVPDVRAGLPDPVQDPVGLSALLGVRALPSATMVLRGLSQHTVRSGDGVFDRLAAFPLSEHDLLTHDGAALVAVPADVPVPALDYPYTVMPRSAERDLAQRLLAVLLDPDTKPSLTANHLRAPDSAVAVPDTDVADEMLNQWAAINLSGRLSILMDVSGSMAQSVPGTGLDRMGVTVAATEAGFGIVKPTTKVGVTLFSTNLDGDRDHEELLPMRTVAEHRETGALDRLRAVRAIPDGATGLYDSTAAIYRTAREQWEPGRLNVVVVMTDGRNEDADGIDLETLLADLRALQDPRRPLPMIAIGIGPDASLDELTTMTTATGGRAFTAPDPTALPEIFYTALSGMLCQPPLCTP